MQVVSVGVPVSVRRIEMSSPAETAMVLTRLLPAVSVLAIVTSMSSAAPFLKSVKIKALPTPGAPSILTYIFVMTPPALITPLMLVDVPFHWHLPCGAIYSVAAEEVSSLALARIGDSLSVVESKPRDQ